MNQIINPPAIIEQSVNLEAIKARWNALNEQESRTLGEIRVARGRLLLEARKAFPAAGPKSRGWGDLLDEWKIPNITAWRYMKLAELVPSEDGKGPTSIPSYREAGFDPNPISPKGDETHPASKRLRNIRTLLMRAADEWEALTTLLDNEAKKKIARLHDAGDLREMAQRYFSAAKLLQGGE